MARIAYRPRLTEEKRTANPPAKRKVKRSLKQAGAVTPASASAPSRTSPLLPQLLKNASGLYCCGPHSWGEPKSGMCYIRLMGKLWRMENIDSNLLHEWDTVSRRIEAIDARLWQGAGILLIISIGGMSLVGGNLPKTPLDLTIVIATALTSLFILGIWWFIFHRWMYLQGVYSYRAREIEEKLGLRFNRYARLLEYWDASDESLGRKELMEEDPEAHRRLQQFQQKQARKRFVHCTIRRCLSFLTVGLGVAWVLFVFLLWTACC